MYIRLRARGGTAGKGEAENVSQILTESLGVRVCVWRRTRKWQQEEPASCVVVTRGDDGAKINIYSNRYMRYYAIMRLDRGRQTFFPSPVVPLPPPHHHSAKCVCVCVDSGRDNYHNHLRRRRRRRRNSPRNGKIIYNPPYARNARAPSPPPRRCCVHVVYTLTFLYYYYYFEISGRPTRGPSPSSAHPFSPDGINAFSYGRVRIIIIRAYRFIFRIVIIIFISRNRRFYEPVKTKYASMFPSRVCAPTGITKGVGGYLLPRAPHDRQRQWRPTTAF